MDIEKTYISADTFLRDTWRLAARVKASGWKPDLLVALWRGGASVGVAIHEYFKATGWSVAHLPLKCASYTGIGANAGAVVFAFGDEIFGTIRPGEKVLVVDDVFDTGKTAKAVKERLDVVGADMRFASVYWKPAKNITDLKPDYFTEDVGTAWIVFPHEIEGLSPAEIARKDPVLAEILADETKA